MADRARTVGSRTPVAVVIVTHGRGGRVAEAAASVLRSTHPALELCVVHQGDDAATPIRLGSARDERARVVTMPPRGLAAARNVGAAHTTAPLIAFTDDDCEADKEWLTAIADAFARDARVGAVFGTVRAPTYDRSAGFIQAYDVGRPRTARSMKSQSTINGIGGCMAIRRATFDAVHGFDEAFGAGAPLLAAEDNDLVMRTLMAGHWVAETPDAVVTHFGFRTWREGARVIAGYMFGLGAMHAKMLRLAGGSALTPTADLAWRWLARGPVADLNHTPSRTMRLIAFLRGVRHGWSMPIDRATLCFTPPPVPPGVTPAGVRTGRS